MGLKLQERKNMEASLNSRDSHFQSYVQKLSHLAAAAGELQHDSLQAAAVHRRRPLRLEANIVPWLVASGSSDWTAFP